MRLQPMRGTKEQRAAVRQRFEELMEPDTALAVIRRHVPSDASPVRAVCSAAREPCNRFVVRVDTETADGRRAAYALKGYMDGRGEQIGELYRALSRDCEQRGVPCPVIQPLGYLRDECLLISPWVHGMSLAEALRAGRADVIWHAPRALAQLHASRIVPEAQTTAREMVQQTVECWGHHYRRFPEARKLITPLTDLLQATLPHLGLSSPVFVHGDAGPENFLLDGEHWRLLDLETYGYADPAFDAGYLLAKLEYECLRLPAFEARTPEMVTMMHRACVEAMPHASNSHMAFFYGLTLIRKVLSQYVHMQPAQRTARWPGDVAHVAARATDALNAVSAGKGQGHAAWPASGSGRNG